MASKLLIVIALLLFVFPSHCVNHKHRFVLVHGAGHGAWCWYKVTASLQKKGHKVDALDLVSAGISSVNASDVKTLVQYNAPLIDLLNSLSPQEKVVLVGHSYGGVSLTYAAEHFPQKIAATVYLTALMLPSGPPAAELFASKIFEPAVAAGSLIRIDGGAAARFNLSKVQDALYNTSPFEDLVLAKVLLKPFPLIDVTFNFTANNYGRVPRYFIKTLQDKIIIPEMQDLMISITPPTGVFEINTDHSAFLTDPVGLLRVLLSIAGRGSLLRGSSEEALACSSNQN